MKVGARGDDVKELQERLNAMGCDVGAADGIFGPATEAGVKAAQEKLGVAATGSWDFMTQAVYDTANKDGESSTPDSNPQ